MSAIVAAESLVNPTEDPSKVERALQNLFPSARIESTNLGNDVVKLAVRGNGLEFLSTLRHLIKQERIRSAARSILMRGTRGTHMLFYLNKQAAFVGRVSFCEPIGESPLGPISIRIETGDASVVIDYLASNPGQGFRQIDHDEM
jgi:predicted RNA binding protein with dsRBD fold (UPF0201 family)